MRYYKPIVSILNVNSTFIRFVFVGIVNTIIGYSLIMLFFHFFHLTYGTSYLLSYIIAFLISFILNRKFVFLSNNNKLQEFIKFILSFLISYSVSYIFLYIVVEYGILDENIAFFGGMAIYSLIFYLLNKHITFKKLNSNS